MKRRDCLVAGAGALLSAGAWADPVALGSVVEWPVIRLLDGAILEPAAWRGQAAIVVLWATYCPFCKRHNAHIDKLVRSTPSRDLMVLGVALDTDEQLVRHYMASNNYRFPVALDGGSIRRQLTARRAIPMTCAIDRQGRLMQTIAGEMFEEDVMELAQSLRKGAA